MKQVCNGSLTEDAQIEQSILINSMMISWKYLVIAISNKYECLKFSIQEENISKI